jgi:hypothetical protein
MRPGPIRLVTKDEPPMRYRYAMRASIDTDAVQIFSAGPISEHQTTACLFYKAFQTMMEAF